jgi:hypothetical protein
VVSSETSRAAAQVAILINGGAATAVIAFLARGKLDPSILRWLSGCLGGYELGVALGSLMIFSIVKSLDYYSVRWRDFAHPIGSFPDSTPIKNPRRKANRWRLLAHWCFGLSMISFIASSCVATWVLATVNA